MATVCFEVECTTVPGELVAVCGSSEALGSWTVEKSLQLDASDYPVWKGRILVEQPAEFKYLIAKKPEQNLQLVRWEGDFKNRTLETIQGQQLLRHRFGDASYESKEIVVEETAAAARPAALDGDASPTRPQLPAAALSPVGRQASGILKDITVDPAVRLTRLVRASSTTSFEDSYELRAGEILGTGMSGGVVVGKNKKTGAEVAIKTLPLNMNKEHIKAEIQHQLAMDHPNICRLLEVYEEPTRLLLVMEKLNGPDLFDAFSKKRRYTETDAVDIVRQILSAVAYCHRNGVCHRDLKLENFCLEDDSENARIKMIDFGLAHSIDDFPMTDSCGTLYYAAPEVLRGNYTERCDMWSLGILTYILLDGRAPFMGRNDRQTYRLILQGEYRFAEERWAHVSANAKDFISKLLQVDPQQRMTAEEATVHPWLATSEGAPSVELDRGILDGLKAFSRSNEVKRAVLSAIAPMASVEQVRKWADQFEALDENGTGQIKVSDLVEKVAQQSGEDVHVAEVLKLTAGTNQEISYSAFLAACLFHHHSSAEEEQFRALFERLDKEKKGKVTVEQVSKALDGLVDLDGLESDFGARELSFTDFRWLLQRPLTPSSLVGLRQLLGLYEDSGIAKSWRVDTVRAKMAGETDEGAIEAARRENAAWRQWHRARLREEKDEDGKLGQ
ncbi:Calcium-dependent protein kinase 10 (OsCDPK10) (OsCPK10) [Durusdinium trenchii]|uniref:Calcium-dependent protein kinase 10 (OsCDPK10) (OsCPK10) n=1 Tax=Durusdinium trenchii TaxID=1381693 RepID=A0ABP0L1U4_9DINO